MRWQLKLGIGLKEKAAPFGAAFFYGLWEYIVIIKALRSGHSAGGLLIYIGTKNVHVWLVKPYPVNAT
ncbi:hypothetical protein RCCS2_07264 [Roseobacter sp. CCS2]|nr:hypothetical protein RCCS2_07264 [Roseobacter sp. CCS2]